MQPADPDDRASGPAPLISPPPPIERLKKRPDFLAAAQAFARPSGAMVVQGRARGDGAATIRLGFTATRRIGGAVARNRAKRRLREAARLIAPLHARAGCDYVFIARSGNAERPWGRLLDDMKTALIRLAADLQAAAGETPPQARRTPRPAP